jgi:hypothetical protein
MWSRARTGVVVLAVAAVVSACGSATSTASPAPTGPLVTVETRGGECFAAPCGQTVILERDGTVHVAAKPPNTLGTVPSDQMRTLSALIATTDFAGITAHPFTGDCPTTYDGREIVFEFRAPSGLKRIATCEVQVDFGLPLFVALSTALSPFIAIPTT